MGYAERHYARKETDTGGYSSRVGGARWWSITRWLLVINIAVFVIDSLLGPSRRVIVDGMRMLPLKAWGFFSYDAAIERMEVWRFVTFQFLHADAMHLFFNMLAIYFFGPMVERYFGSARFLRFYLLCGVAGPLAYLALWSADVLVTASWIPLVGASAGIFGILISAAMIAPEARVMLLFPPIPIRLKTMAWIFIGIAVVTVLREGPNAGGEAAHLGGALAGFLLMRYPRVLSIFSGWKWGSKRGQTLDGDSSWRSLQEDRAKRQAEIDRILDKVSSQGIGSLTDAEKRTLRDETERQRGR